MNKNVIWICITGVIAGTGLAEITPGQLEFRRQAVRRMIFDKSQEIPLDEGDPSPFMLLTMDRSNLPGMPTPKWTYGAMYLYHGYFFDKTKD